LFGLPKSSFGRCKVPITSPVQVEVFVEMFEMGLVADGRTECVFEALFKGVSTRFGLRIVEKCFENAFEKIGSDFQNLRLGEHKIATRNHKMMIS
jgi:hypothetical protein